MDAYFRVEDEYPVGQYALDDDTLGRHEAMELGNMMFLIMCNILRIVEREVHNVLNTIAAHS